MQNAILPNYLLESLNPSFGYFIKKEKTLVNIQTEYQKLEVLETKIFGRVLRLDNVFQTSEKDEFLYHETLVHPSGISIGNPKNALVIGGGDGGTIEEIFKYPSIEEVHLIELDKKVVEFSQKYLPSISKNAFQSPKLNLLIGDGIQYIHHITKKMDMIILDLTDPIGDSIHLYTKEFYQMIREKLSNTGCLSLHIESPISKPFVFARIYKTLSSVFQNVNIMLNYVPLYGTLWGFAIASETINPKLLSQTKIQNKIAEDNIQDLQFYNAYTHFSLFHLPNYIDTILQQNVDIISMQNKLENDQKYHLNDVAIYQL